ncbi:PREDICTED: uncharacterized protein LOC108547292 [Eufriesea mexicana]|uniref:uncharacterized protein LOC108547292 n=1 Tax=Eufriesea mexicana TaxID=516756 RepID=UPI00083C7EEF|nr:PREDICTED: uncharacterized protein LOC108547292 [Eufriesea mexicana]
MFGRQIFLEPVDNQRNHGHNEFIRQFSANQRNGIPFAEVLNVPSLRNDGLMLDLNFILVEDNDHGQPNNLYFRTNRGNIPNRYLLEYIRQMEERYLIMEKELTRAKMLIPIITRNTNVVHQSSQTDVNWKQCSLTKYGHFLGTSSKNQYKKNQDQMNVSSKKKYYTTKRNKDSVDKFLTDSNWIKHRNLSQNLQNDIYPMKEPDSNEFRSESKTLTNNSTAVCSIHNIAMILSQNSTQLTNLSSHEQTNFKANSDIHKDVDKCDLRDSQIIFGNSTRQLGSFETQKTSMEVCQSIDKKYEPETPCCTDFDVKHEDYAQTKLAVNTPDFRPITRSKFNNDISGQATSHNPNLTKYNTNFDEKCINRNCWTNYAKLPYERTRCTNDSSRQFTRIVKKQKKETYKKIPTPRSNVHTAYTPMVQSSSWNPILDPNGFTIQLLRLAVLLYAPILMPALNSLIAQQSTQTTIPIPIPCTEGSNDLLTQIFTILTSQQCVPNLPYVPNSRMDENPRQSQESNPHNLSSYSNSLPKDLSKQLRNDTCNVKSFEKKQFEKNSIAVNTSLEICSCKNVKPSSSQYSRNTLRDQIEEDENLIYTWIDKESKLSETEVLEKTMLQCERGKENILEKEDKNSEFSYDLSTQADTDDWNQVVINDIWGL